MSLAEDAPEDQRTFFATHPHAGRAALAGEALQAQYRINWIPTFFLVGADGKLALPRSRLDQVVAYLDARGTDDHGGK